MPRLRSLRPSRLPVRWRLAIGSALLTTAILILFAAVVGRLAENRLNRDFDSDLRATASALAARVEVLDRSDFGRIEVEPAVQLEELARSQEAAIRVVTATGEAVFASEGAPELGPPSDQVVRRDGLHVASEIIGPLEAQPAVFIQYARSAEDVRRTISRLWLFLGFGVLGGAGMATLAGLAVASRAMRPVSELTSRARSIEQTRDPSIRIPDPDSDDEVAELARTLDQMLRALDDARAETLEAAERQREFVADASHELRTPLTSVLANLELLQEASPEGSEPREIAEAALRSSRRMRRLVTDLLLLARADAGRRSGRVPCDLSRIAHEAGGEVGAGLDGEKIRVDAPKPVMVEGSPDELHRLVANLIDNGIRHTPPGTTVSVRVRGDGEATLVVSDDGPGLPPELRDRLFERFVRGGGDAGAGTGLGLAIVKVVAETHGGSVEAGESEGGGARMTVRLPLSEAGREAPSNRGAKVSPAP